MQARRRAQARTPRRVNRAAVEGTESRSHTCHDATQYKASPQKGTPSCARAQGGDCYAAIFTYSKSPGLLSMPTRGGAIQLANLPGSVTDVIRLLMNSPSSVDG